MPVLVYVSSLVSTFFGHGTHDPDTRMGAVLLVPVYWASTPVGQLPHHQCAPMSQKPHKVQGHAEVAVQRP